MQESEEVETSEQTLRDGTLVRTRITNTRRQQLTTERLVLGGARLFEQSEGGAEGGQGAAGGQGEDEVFDTLRRLGSPRPSASTPGGSC